MRTQTNIARKNSSLQVMLRLSFGLFILLSLTYGSEQLQVAGQHSLAPTIWLNNHDLPRRPSDKLTSYLNRIGPNMRASTNYHDYRDINLNESIEAWQLLHEQAKHIAQDQVQLYRTHLDRLLEDANVSLPCVKSVDQALDSMERLDSWALEMHPTTETVWSATSNFPPIGLIDGYFTQLGSYRGCVDIKPPATKLSSNFSQTTYCVVAFRPILPERPRFHSIFHRVDKKLVNMFNESDFFHSLLTNAQYFYYLYTKMGVCVPYTCTPGDVQKVSGLIGRRLALASGPAKCFTRALAVGPYLDSIKPYLRHEQEEISSGNIENEPILIQLNKSLNCKQKVSLILIGSFFAIVLLSTVWHALELLKNKISATGNLDTDDEPNKVYAGHSNQNLHPNPNDQIMPISTPDPKRRRQSILVSRSSGVKYLAFHYFSLITNGDDFLNTSLRSNEIKCLHGFRVLTMIWIICVHTLQYNEWSEFSRVYETVNNLKNPIMQPMINANYVVDNFFLMSGLLVTYTAWFANKGTSSNFSVWTSLLGRYLRLTPQALLVSLLYILLPLAGDGPFWYDMTHDAAKNCEKNWWVNLLHLQAFYRDNEMCNLVGWWISVDMFYYLFALAFLWMILNNKVTSAVMGSIVVVTLCTIATTYRHYVGGFTPNNLGSVPQIDEVWTEYVVLFNWSPYPHAYVFFLGLWIGYVLANDKWKHWVRRWSGVGWTISLTSLIVVNFSSHIWISGAFESDNQVVSTTYNIVCTTLWASAFGWIVVALHYGSLPFLSKLLSIDIVILLSKASFIIYLSHMLLIRMAFGMQYNTLELSFGVMMYIMIGNVALAIVFGVFLCVAFEGPFMKFQRWVIAKIRPNRKLPVAGLVYSTVSTNNHDQAEKMSLSLGPITTVLLK